MSVTEYDAIILGAGVAGLTAGTYLACRGFKVALVTTGEPTACLSTGCIDVCSRDSNPLTGINGLPPAHPFHLASEGSRPIIRRFLKARRGLGQGAKWLQNRSRSSWAVNPTGPR